ncbi:unnamed protein product [Soboliphyme baturini]|uniref:Rho-GAP domain-containing protein n=1 Tax=Soboliphyme baturini TaxID=241478 RepID=A0A183IR51_9BILA|nr:unnamed protein product [Soboliphyme baturini]
MIGVYRIPGNTAAVHSLSAKANEGFETIDFTDIRWRDVNVVSSLLKAFFRNLPEPLLTNELYFHFIEASRLENADEKLSKLTQLVRSFFNVVVNSSAYSRTIESS